MGIPSGRNVSTYNPINHTGALHSGVAAAVADTTELAVFYEHTVSCPSPHHHAPCCTSHRVHTNMSGTPAAADACAAAKQLAGSKYASATAARSNLHGSACMPKSDAAGPDSKVGEEVIVLAVGRGCSSSSLRVAATVGVVGSHACCFPLATSPALFLQTVPCFPPCTSTLKHQHRPAAVPTPCCSYQPASTTWQGQHAYTPTPALAAAAARTSTAATAAASTQQQRWVRCDTCGAAGAMADCAA